MEFIHYIVDFILHIDVHLTELVAQYGVWVYAILFVILFAKPGWWLRHSCRAIRCCLLRGHLLRCQPTASTSI